MVHDKNNDNTLCKDCGKCCLHMYLPPGFVHILVPAEEGEQSIHSADDPDIAYWESAPPEAKKIITDIVKESISFYDKNPNGRMEIPDGPCVWFDTLKKQCRFYDSRPEICRDFEVDGDDCKYIRLGMPNDGKI